MLDTVEQLKQLEQDNTLLSEANQVLTTEVEADTQVFETNQREIGSNLDQLTTEKEALTSQVIMLKGSIATKQAENEALVQEIEQAKQGKISPKHQEDDMQLQISLLKAHAAIGDLFLDAKQVELAEEKDETVVAMENV
ncbi:hypothetical protein FACS1894192_12770 [Bacilli bacterium]|nr:hypothetical protein FACS1894192_12770 [Bacilli bacterium]